MAISEESRYEMYVKLEEVLGAPVANTMMQHLPPVGWADVATSRDLDAQTALMRRDLESQTALIRRDVESQTALMRRDVGALTVLFDSKLDALRLDVRAELRGEINRLVFWQFPTVLTLLALAFAAAKLS